MTVYLVSRRREVSFEEIRTYRFCVFSCFIYNSPASLDPLKTKEHWNSFLQSNLPTRRTRIMAHSLGEFPRAISERESTTHFFRRKWNLEA